MLRYRDINKDISRAPRAGRAGGPATPRSHREARDLIPRCLGRGAVVGVFRCGARKGCSLLQTVTGKFVMAGRCVSDLRTISIMSNIGDKPKDHSSYHIKLQFLQTPT